MARAEALRRERAAVLLGLGEVERASQPLADGVKASLQRVYAIAAETCLLEREEGGGGEGGGGEGGGSRERDSADADGSAHGGVERRASGFGEPLAADASGARAACFCHPPAMR
eukprot:2251149-Prymnesium_polylepis.1